MFVEQGSTGIPVLIPYPGIPSLFIPIPIPPGLNSKSRIFRDFTKNSKFPIYILYISYICRNTYLSNENCSRRHIIGNMCHKWRHLGATYVPPHTWAPLGRHLGTTWAPIQYITFVLLFYITLIYLFNIIFYQLSSTYTLINFKIFVARLTFIIINSIL